MKKTISILLCFLLLLTAAIPGASALQEEGGYIRMTGIRQALHALFNKKEILNTRYEGEVSTETWSEEDVYSLDNTFIIDKQADKDFVILNFTDTHFADYDYRAFTAFLASATMRRLVNRVQPDLMTVSGDIVCSDSTAYAVRRITDLMTSFEIPWAPVFGNHDAEGNCDANYLADIMMKSPYCLFRKGDPEMGNGNYIINIREQNGERSEIVHSLIMMDTHSSHLNEKQIRWYRWAAEGICEITGKDTESTVIFHIPNAHYQFAYDAAWDSDNGAWRDGFAASGECNEKICCPRDSDGNPVDNGFFDTVKAVGTTKNIFCGHEHLNNFSIEYEGVRMTYMLKVGMASGFRFGFNGGTKIVLSDEGISFEHLYSL